MTWEEYYIVLNNEKESKWNVNKTLFGLPKMELHEVHVINGNC